MNYYLLKILRLTGWALLLLVSAYLVTGFAMCGKYGVQRWLNVETAALIHKAFDLPLLTVFAAHSILSTYFAFRRWGWLKR